MASPGFCSKFVLAGVAALAALASLGTAYAEVTVLHAFTGGKDGAYPEAGLMKDSAGNFYGTTFEGGGTGCHDRIIGLLGRGCGTVFKLAPDGTETVLYAFRGLKHADGAMPSAGLIQDNAGNFYGTTTLGGVACGEPQGCGTVFKLAPDGTETVLYAFTYGSDGAYPRAGLIRDKAGNVYGTASQGGNDGVGTVFEIAPDGTFTVLYSFGQDAEVPFGGLIRDRAGNLYSTTTGGCAHRCGERAWGTVFKLTPEGKLTVLYSFAGGRDGAWPEAGLIRDMSGNFYGTTSAGGCASDCGTVFKLARDGTETVLHDFTGGSDGAEPVAGVIRDSAGNLFGTTSAGAGSGCWLDDGCGTVFKIAPDGTEAVLFAFGEHKNDGTMPNGGLIEGGDGRLYGTASGGGDRVCKYGGKLQGCGTVFALKK